MKEMKSFCCNQQGNGLDDLLLTKQSSSFSFKDKNKQTYNVNIEYVVKTYTYKLGLTTPNGILKQDFTSKQDVREAIVKVATRVGFKEDLDSIELNSELDSFLNNFDNNNFDSFDDFDDTRKEYIRKLNKNSENYIDKIPDQYIDDQMLMIACDKGYMGEKYSLIQQQTTFDYIWNKIITSFIQFNYLESIPDKFKTQQVYQDYTIRFKSIKGVPQQYLSEQVQLEAVKQSGYAIEYIENPSEQVQLEAVKQSGYALKYVENPSEQVQLEAVKKNGISIRYIKNPSKQVQLEAVKQNGFAIQYIKDPSEQVQLEAVKQNGDAIDYIENPTEQVQLEAVKQNWYAIKYIKDPSEQVRLQAVKEYIKKPTS